MKELEKELLAIVSEQEENIEEIEELEEVIAPATGVGCGGYC